MYLQQVKTVPPTRSERPAWQWKYKQWQLDHTCSRSHRFQRACGKEWKVEWEGPDCIGDNVRHTFSTHKNPTPVDLLSPGHAGWSQENWAGKASITKWIVSAKAWAVEELETLHAGTKPPSTWQHRSPGGERRRKRQRFTIYIYIQRPRQGHYTVNQTNHGTVSKATLCKLWERVERIWIFPEHLDIILNWTELNWNLKQNES